MDYGFHMTITKWDEVVSKEMEIMVTMEAIFLLKCLMEKYRCTMNIFEEILLA